MQVAQASNLDAGGIQMALCYAATSDVVSQGLR